MKRTVSVVAMLAFTTGAAFADCSKDGDNRVYCDGKEIGQASRAPLGGYYDNCTRGAKYGSTSLKDNSDEAIQSILARCKR